MSSGWQNVKLNSSLNLHTIFQCNLYKCYVCWKYRKHHSTENLKLNESPNESVCKYMHLRFPIFKNKKKMSKNRGMKKKVHITLLSPILVSDKETQTTSASYVPFGILPLLEYLEW